MDPEIVDQMRALGDCLRRAALAFAFSALRHRTEPMVSGSA